MTVDHILFNNQSWYSVAENADSTTISGKKYYAVPSKITIKQGTSLKYPSQGTDQGYFTGHLQEDLEVECVGANDKHYFFVGAINGLGDGSGVDYTYWEDEGYGVGEVLKSDCKSVVW